MLDCIDINYEHLKSVASIHSTSYPEDHVSGSMTQQLIVDYYTEFLSGENFFYGCVSDSLNRELLGFVVFGKGLPDRVTKFKRNNRLSLIIFFLSHLNIFYRLIFKRLVASFQRKDNFEEAENLILSIAVKKGASGVGPFLMDAIDKCYKKNEVSKLGLYVACSNVRALNFYYKNGFKVKAFVSGQYYMEKEYE